MRCRMTRFALTLLVAVPLVSSVLAMSAEADRDGRADKKKMTGVWRTASPAGWVTQSQAGVLLGDTQMRWELEEDENGLISGFNLWFSANPASEGRPSVGAMCMVGARNGEDVVITEARIRDRLVPTFEFECKHRRGNRTRCVGNGLASQPPIALTGRMKRLKNPDEGVGDLPVALIEAVRTFCSVGGQRPEDPLLLGGRNSCPAPYVLSDYGFPVPPVCCIEGATTVSAGDCYIP